MTLKRPLQIAMVAGEISGDLLGAGLIREFKKNSLLDVEFSGIGGSKMIAEGFHSSIDIKRLSVMGIGSVLLHYPDLLRIRYNLYIKWIKNPPDVFIGIDYSYFNLSLAFRLKRKGIKTVQLASPKVWAWRQKRVFYIKKAVDLVLTLFPFEEEFLQKHGVPAQFIGHPLADLIPLETNKDRFKNQLGYKTQDKLITILPGSRAAEIKHMGPLFLDVMREINAYEPQINFIVPMANNQLRKLFVRQVTAKSYTLNLKITDGNARDAIAAADVVLVKSGTATLEAMLLKRPMVVAYKCDRLTYSIISPQLKVPFISLPNLLAKKKLVSEYIQEKAIFKPIAEELLHLLNNDDAVIVSTFTEIHKKLQQNTNEKAALSILKLLEATAL